MTVPDTVAMTAVVAAFLHRRDLAAGREVNPQPSPDDLDDADRIVHALVAEIRRDLLAEVTAALTRLSWTEWIATLPPDDLMFMPLIDQVRALIEYRLAHV